MSPLANTRKKKNQTSILWWILGILGVLGCAGLSAIAFFLWQSQQWAAKARELDYSRLSEMESASQVFDRHGELIGKLFVQNRDQKPLAELSPFLQKAVVSAEDARFQEHQGVDFRGIARAITRNFQAGKARQGASTLTQQLARNTFPEVLPSEDRSVRRKLLEMFVAWEIEKQISKSQILEHYLNRVFFGAGFYGAEAAAQGYFGKPAKDLTLSEAALLAGLLRSPNNLSPWRNRKACLESRNHVLFRMRELEAITESQYRLALADEPMVKNRRPSATESYVIDMVSSYMNKLVGSENALSEGYRIYTTIDLKLQRKAEATLQAQLAQIEQRPEFQKRQTYAQFEQIHRAWKRSQVAGAEDPAPKPEYLQGSVILLDNATGAIRAIVGGRDAKHSEFNRALQAKRPAGSAFLPLVFATAFEKGLHPHTVVQDAVMDNRQVMVGGMSGILGEWAREQANTVFEGPISAKTALVKSKNAASVRLGMLIGDDLKQSLEFLSASAKNAGIESPLRAFPATFLGSSEVTPMELTLSYTTFPNLGQRPAFPFVVDRIEEKNGHVLHRTTPDQKRAFSEGPAYQVHDALTAALQEGTGAQAFTKFGLKRAPFAGKTGTAYNFTDTWFVGYSSELTCGVWIGFDKPRTPIFFGAFGSELALPVWTELMNASLPAYAAQPLARPDSLRSCSLCGASGYAVLPGCQSAGSLIEAWLSDSQRPGSDEPCDVHGPKRPRKKRSSGESPSPRAELAFDPTQVAPIALKSPSVIGEDPFFALQAEQTARAIKNLKEAGSVAPLENQAPSLQKTDPAPAPETPVPKAEPVKPSETLPVKPTAPPLPSLPKLDF
jgi:membrane peptidoglycan carboxypeptidase